MKVKNKKLIRGAMVLGGIALTLVPSFGKIKADTLRADLLESYTTVEQHSVQLDEKHNERIYNLLEEDTELLLKIKAARSNKTVSRTKSAKADNQKAIKKPKLDVRGVLKIPKIDFEQVILYDATDANLDISVSMMKESVKFGEIGNCIIAGHNSKKYGKHFDRLPELKKKDLVYVTDKEAVYTYEIYKYFIVKSDEGWVLNHPEDESRLTLMSCTYINGETRRLIVLGKLIAVE